MRYNNKSMSRNDSTGVQSVANDKIFIWYLIMIFFLHQQVIDK